MDVLGLWQGWIIDDDQQHISVGVCPSLAVVDVVIASSTKQLSRHQVRWPLLGYEGCV